METMAKLYINTMPFHRRNLLGILGDRSIFRRYKMWGRPERKENLGKDTEIFASLFSVALAK